MVAVPVPDADALARNEGPPGRPKATARNQAPKPTRIIVPKNRPPARIKVPIDLALSPPHRVDAIHTLLQIQPAHRDLFCNLATQHLFDNYDLSTLYSQPQNEITRDHLAPPAASFLEAHGSRLWPSDLAHQSHLFKAELSTQPGNFWAFRHGQYGPEFAADGIPKASTISWWSKKLGGRGLSAEECAGLSKLGAVMLVYFAALVDGDGLAPITGGEGEEERLKKIVGEEGSYPNARRTSDRESSPDTPLRMVSQGRDDSNAIQASDRESSPDVPLRVTSSRSKSREVQPSAIVVFPGLVNHWSKIGFEKLYCVLEGCHLQRKAVGMMVGCENETCSIEWFHPGCVGLEGQDLKDLEWTCSNCMQQASSGVLRDVSMLENGPSRPGSTDALLDSIRGFVDADQQVVPRVRGVLPGADEESSRSLFVSSSPSAGIGEYRLATDDVRTSARIARPSPANLPIASSKTIEQDTTSVEQAASDDAFIEAMQSSMSNARPATPGQIESVLAGLSSHLRQDTAPPSTEHNDHDEHTDARPPDSMETEPSDALFQALITPDPPVQGMTQHEQQLQQVRQYSQQLTDQWAAEAWEDSSTGVRRAMRRTDHLEREPSFQAPATHGSQSEMQQQRQPLHRPSRVSHHRSSASPESISTFAAQHHQRQQSLAMPPPPPRSAGAYYQPGYTEHMPPQAPQQQVTFVSGATLQSRNGPPPPNGQPIVFAPVAPLPPHLWVLPTPQSTYQVGATSTGKSTPWQKARTAHYLALTGGKGGLPMLE